MAYTLKIQSAVFTNPNISPPLYNATSSHAFIYIGPSGRDGGVPIYTGGSAPAFSKNNKFLIVIGAQPIRMEDDAFRRLGISQWRSQLADLVQRDIIEIDDGGGPLTVNEVMQLWSRSPWSLVHVILKYCKIDNKFLFLYYLYNEGPAH